MSRRHHDLAKNGEVEEAKAVYDATNTFRVNCLENDGSLFFDDAKVWTTAKPQIGRLTLRFGSWRSNMEKVDGVDAIAYVQHEGGLP